MLSNCEKMVVISSTTNEWPQLQTHNIDEKDLMASTARLMEKPAVTQEQQQQPQQQPQQQIQQQQALKCPRCDSSNTKFCYYNNYSLSQPRHFCKACKRYWTRGGTLRNVPVGGGCRKNKRVKRPASAIDAAGGASSTSGAANPNLSHSHQPQIDVSSTSSPHHINPLFYGLTNNPSDINNNLPFPARFNSTGGGGGGGGYDLQPQLNALALGFSSGGDSHHDYGNGFNVNPSKQIQDVSNPLLSSYSNLFGSSSSSSNTPTIASLLASTLHHHKFMNGGVKNTTQNTPNHFQALPPFQDLQVTGNNTTENGLSMKDHVKVELEGQSRSMEWNVNVGCQNQLEQIGLSDPAVYWNPTSVGGGGAWHDPSNIGSSVTSLI